jgi:hypothetical protein
MPSQSEAKLYFFFVETKKQIDFQGVIEFCNCLRLYPANFVAYFAARAASRIRGFRQAQLQLDFSIKFILPVRASMIYRL